MLSALGTDVEPEVDEGLPIFQRLKELLTSQVTSDITYTGGLLLSAARSDRCRYQEGTHSRVRCQSL